MNDLISRSGTVAAICRLYTNHGKVQMGINLALDAVEEQPSVPAEVVRHGRWMIHHYDMEKYECTETPYDPKVFDTWDGNMYCSNCKGEALCNGREEQVPSNRCPHCGAIMDGQGEGDSNED